MGSVDDNVMMYAAGFLVCCPTNIHKYTTQHSHLHTLSLSLSSTVYLYNARALSPSFAVP